MCYKVSSAPEPYNVSSWTDGNGPTYPVLLECSRKLHTGSSVCCLVCISSQSFLHSQEELRKFIKFACNQERIPFGHPCRDGGTEHVPPYPMKIAPPDGKGTCVAALLSGFDLLFP